VAAHMREPGVSPDLFVPPSLTWLGCCWQAKQVGDEAPWCSVTSLLRARQSMQSALRGRPVTGATGSSAQQQKQHGSSGTAYGRLPTEDAPDGDRLPVSSMGVAEP